jgi:hypothetical protein
LKILAEFGKGPFRTIEQRLTDAPDHCRWIITSTPFSRTSNARMDADFAAADFFVELTET